MRTDTAHVSTPSVSYLHLLPLPLPAARICPSSCSLAPRLAQRPSRHLAVQAVAATKTAAPIKIIIQGRRLPVSLSISLTLRTLHECPCAKRMA